MINLRTIIRSVVMGLVFAFSIIATMVLAHLFFRGYVADVSLWEASLVIFISLVLTVLGAVLPRSALKTGQQRGVMDEMARWAGLGIIFGSISAVGKALYQAGVDTDQWYIFIPILLLCMILMWLFFRR